MSAFSAGPARRCTSRRVAGRLLSSRTNVTRAPGSSSEPATRLPSGSSARQVRQDRDRAVLAVGGGAHARGFGVLGRAAVGEVQPRDVHSGVDHPDEDLGLARGGTDRGDDLCAAHDRRDRSGQRVKTPSCCTTSPSALNLPPARRSQIMSQCTADSFVPARLRIGAAEREVHGAADLLVEQDRAGRAIDAGVRPDADLAQRAGARTDVQRREQVLVAAFGARRDDAARARPTRARVDCARAASSRPPPNAATSTCSRRWTRTRAPARWARSP